MKKGQVVLMRSDGRMWCKHIYERTVKDIQDGTIFYVDSYRYIFEECLPLEGNENLLYKI